MGVLDFLNNAKMKGKIRYAGFSFHDDSIGLFREIVDAYNWDFCQIQYNYLDENYQAGKEGLEYAVEKGLGIVIMEPLKGGGLAENMPPEAISEFEKVNPERKPVDWAFNWLWNHANIHVVLSGMNNLEQIIENIGLGQKAKADSLSNEEIKAVDKVKLILKEKNQVSCTTCGYCMPCPNGVDIPRNFLYYNNYHRFDDDKIRLNSKIMYNSLLTAEQQAVSCIECGACEELCPQKIPIMDSLKEVAETMKQDS
jgi:predicted aldo/keto reductase-like oxidoreductase